MVPHRRHLRRTVRAEPARQSSPALKAAKKYRAVGLLRPELPPTPCGVAIGGLEKAREVNREVAGYVDVMIGNEEDFTACLGLQVEGNDENLKELNLDGYYR